MYTVCSNCASVHALEAATLATAGGQVRCARCGEVFDALEALFDDYPDGRKGGASRRADAEPPELGRKPAPEFPVRPEEPPAASRPALLWPWTTAVALLAVVTIVNMVWTFQEEIPRDSALYRTLESWSVPGFEPQPPFRDPTRIHLLSRDMHVHPTQPGVLVLSATFANLADQAQPFPDVSIALKNPEGGIIAARRFNPSEYLVQAPAQGARLAAGQQVPMVLEFADPGERATGFELRFH